MHKDKLRKATVSDLDDPSNRTFYFYEGINKEVLSRIVRRIPQDYPNFANISGKNTDKIKEDFRDSCRWDWRITTKKMRDLLTLDNLWIQIEKQ
jgi:hypothetical protein